MRSNPYGQNDDVDAVMRGSATQDLDEFMTLLSLKARVEAVQETLHSLRALQRSRALSTGEPDGLRVDAVELSRDNAELEAQIAQSIQDIAQAQAEMNAATEAFRVRSGKPPGSIPESDG